MPPALLRPCARSGCDSIQRSTYCDAHRPNREQGLRRHNHDVRRWYYTTRWQALRRRKLAEQPFCPECEREGRPVTDTTDVDHRRPHRGDPALFWDYDNLDAYCHAHHSAKTRRGE